MEAAKDIHVLFIPDKQSTMGVVTFNKHSGMLEFKKIGRIEHGFMAIRESYLGKLCVLLRRMLLDPFTTKTKPERYL